MRRCLKTQNVQGRRGEATCGEREREAGREGPRHGRICTVRYSEGGVRGKWRQMRKVA